MLAYNVQALRNDLKETFDALRSNDNKVKIDHKVAGAAANVAGKIIGTTIAQLRYYHLRNEVPEIEFLMENKNRWTRGSKSIPKMKKIPIKRKKYV